MPQLLPVFLYHRVDVDAGADEFTVDPETFARHLELIAASGRVSLTMTELAQALRGERPLPEAAVGLTFDDGYADTRATLEAAAAMGVKSTLYVTTGTIDTCGAITSQDLIALASAPEFVELGAHTVTHPRLDELRTVAAQSEITASRRALAAVASCEVRSFAYPHGAYSARIRRLVLEAGFESAAAVKNAISHEHDDPWAIARFTIRAGTPLSQLEAVLQGEGAPLAWRRERLRTRGYRALRTGRRELSELRDVGKAAPPTSPASATGHYDRGTTGLRAPVAVAQLDLARPDTQVHLPVRSIAEYTAVVVLVRYGQSLVAWTAIDLPSSGVLSIDQLPPELRHREPPAEQPAVPSRSSLSVVVTTCADADSTLTCLRSVLVSDRLPSELIVVENRPTGSTVAQTISRAFPDPPIPIRVVEQVTRGLAAARNAGLAAANTELVAFTDDDVSVDRYWVSALCRAFEADSALACVTGLILPLELESDAQMEFEHFTSLGKGLSAQRFSMSAPTSGMPLFPYSAGHFGSGANAAFRRDALEAIGGFDPLLGAGTRTRGGEDLDIYIRLLTNGYDLAYEPTAIVWHRHPDDDAGVSQRVFSYGVGFGAVVSKLILSRHHRSTIMRMAPAAVVYWFNPRSRKNAARSNSTTSAADQLRETAGVALGAFAYMASRIPARLPRNS